MFHDGPKTCPPEAFPGRVGGLRISVRADLHAIIFVCLRRKNERGKFFLLQTRRELQRISFLCQRRYLQRVSTAWNGRRVRSFR